MRVGASPRVRGRRHQRHEGRREGGSIPAGAGPTARPVLSARTAAEHPRGCGADRVAGAGLDGVDGASPRVRGRPSKRLYGNSARGSIPAGAGPTHPPGLAVVRLAEHPRGCGADPWLGYQGLLAPGASPRVRGRHRDPRQPGAHPGSIPAGAGPTPPPASAWTSTPEHPRGCGADSRAASGVAYRNGASPRVRGRPGTPCPRCRPGRSIPAGAGPTCPSVNSGPAAPEHPRGCGADHGGVPPEVRARGASPRVRGRRRLAPGLLLAGRSIPAGAGPTGRGERADGRVGEHPRGCGADLIPDTRKPRLGGASPRVRGRRPGGGGRGRGRGSIPAGAGPTTD